MRHYPDRHFPLPADAPPRLRGLVVSALFTDPDRRRVDFACDTPDDVTDEEAAYMHRFIDGILDSVAAETGIDTSKRTHHPAPGLPEVES